jgi:hypothetical protein
MRARFAAAIFFLAISAAQGQEPAAPQTEKTKETHADCPMLKTHSHDEPGVSGMNERGAKGMGFPQTATTHHFILKADGGAIQVEANNPADTASRDSIRMHLSHIAKAFDSGDFAIPMFVHDTVLPGLPVMKEMAGKMTYKYEEIAAGGRVVILTMDPKALEAVQQFLRFQIAKHKTGDATIAEEHPRK